MQIVTLSHHKLGGVLSVLCAYFLFCVCLKAICRSGVELMRVARGGGGLVLSIGTSSGQVFIVSIISDTLLWWPLEADTSGKRKVKR